MTTDITEFEDIADAPHAQSIPVYSSEMLTAVNGANIGDSLSFADDMMLEDTYGLSPGATLRRLSFHTQPTGAFIIADDSEIGTPGAALHLDSCLTLMTFDSQITELLVLVELDSGGHVAETYGLPLGQLIAKTDYTLVGIDHKSAMTRFAQVACVSFTRGTRIALATGAQIPIEELKINDKVLTRDDGAQTIRWIGQTTVRATGDFAPVVVSAGALHNENDLVLSPDHRLFIYQRSDEIGVGRSEILAKVRHLVNDDTIYVQDGGFVDYFQLLFDAHQIIFAEGIAAETLLINARTRAALPDGVESSIPTHDERAHSDIEVGKNLLDRPDIAAALRRATRGE